MPRLLHASDTDPFSTLVPGRNSSEKATERITFHPTLSASPHPEEALSAMLGVTLNRQGGPLAPSQIKLRGLSGARTSIALDGLDLSDPLSGLFDANDIPFFALSAVQNEGILSDSLGGDIRLSLPPPGKYFLNALAGVGSLGHARTQITAQAPLSSSVDALAGALLGTSRGDFEFLIPDSDPQRFEVRKNNDQHRLLTLTRLSLRTAKAHWSGTFFARIHEGGVAGFALNPTPNLRARHSFGGGVATAKFGLGRGAITSQLQTSFDARDTQDDSQQTRFEVHSLMHRFNIESMHPLQSFASELALGFGAEHRQILSTDFSRPGGEVFARFQNDWNGKWKPRLQVQI